MYQPELFVQCNDIPKIAARTALKRHLILMNVKDDGSDTFLEIGCGPADITKHILLPALPRDFKKFISSDISEVMIKYAKLNNADPLISYKILDIATQESLKKFGSFNHIFCFFVMHFVDDHRQALKNMNELLTPGGNILVTQVTTCPYYHMYELLVKKGLWTEYMYDYEKYVTPYYTSEDPKQEFRDVLVEQGFFVNFIELYDKCHQFSSVDSFKNLMEAVNPFLIRIPKPLHKAYIGDLLNAAIELNIITSVQNNEKVSFNFKVLEAVATKLSLY